MGEAGLTQFAAGGGVFGNFELVWLQDLLARSGAMIIAIVHAGGLAMRQKFDARDARAINCMKSESGPLSPGDI
ncbi:MAG: hypothetical protein C0474_10095 [Sphingobium sp.]|nr:hypothetical protein [Sphingobium sp.]